MKKVFILLIFSLLLCCAIKATPSKKYAAYVVDWSIVNQSEPKWIEGITGYEDKTIIAPSVKITDCVCIDRASDEDDCRAAVDEPNIRINRLNFSLHCWED